MWFLVLIVNLNLELRIILEVGVYRMVMGYVS